MKLKLKLNCVEFVQWFWKGKITKFQLRSVRTRTHTHSAWWVSECEFNFIWIEFMMQFKVQTLPPSLPLPLPLNKYINKRHWNWDEPQPESRILPWATTNWNYTKICAPELINCTGYLLHYPLIVYNLYKLYNSLIYFLASDEAELKSCTQNAQRKLCFSATLELLNDIRYE